MGRVSKADAIRNRLRFLYEMGDAAVPNEAWRDTNENLEKEYGWVLDEAILVSPWPPGCEYDEPDDPSITVAGPGGKTYHYTEGDDCDACGMPYFHDDQLRCACCGERRTKQ